MFAGTIGSSAPEFSPTPPVMLSIPAPPAWPSPPPDSPRPAPALVSPSLPALALLEIRALPAVPPGDPAPPPTGEIESSAQRLPTGRASRDDTCDGSAPTITRALSSLPLSGAASSDGSVLWLFVLASGAGGGTGACRWAPVNSATLMADGVRLVVSVGAGSTMRDFFGWTGFELFGLKWICGLGTAVVPTSTLGRFRSTVIRRSGADAL